MAYLFLIVTLIGILGIALAGIFIKLGRRLPRLAFEGLSYFSVFHPNFLYMPLHLKGLEIAKGLKEIDDPDIGQRARLALASLGLSINFLLAFGLLARFTETVDYKSCLGVRSKLPFVGILMQKTVLGILFFALNENEDSKYFFGGILIVPSLLLLLACMGIMPFYRHELNKIPAIFLPTNLAFVLNGLFNAIVDSSKSATYLFLPIFCITAALLNKVVIIFAIEPDLGWLFNY